MENKFTQNITMDSTKEKEFLNTLQLAIMTVIVLIFCALLFLEAYQTFKFQIPFVESNVVEIINRSKPFFDKKFLASLLFFVLVLYAIQVPAKINLRATKNTGNAFLAAGALCFSYAIFGSDYIENPTIYISSLSAAIIGMIISMVNAGIIFNSLVNVPLKDMWNEYNEQFPQNAEIIENEMSVLYRYQYKYGNKWNVGHVNVVAPDRAVIVIGGQGAGKTFTIFNPAIHQMVAKGYSIYCYDFAYPDLSLVIFNAYMAALKHNKYTWGKDRDNQPIIPIFNNINFEDLRRSNRSNPFAPKYMNSIDECYEKCKTLLNNLNRSWISKEGDFWATSAYNLLTSVVWFLRLIERNNQDDPVLSKVCTLPHAIYMLTMKTELLVAAMEQEPELEAYVNMFAQGLSNQAGSQIAGQVASTQSALAPLSAPNIVWVMSYDDMDLEINNTESPRIITAGNFGEKAAIYGAALSVYTSNVMKMSYKNRDRKFALILDELPTKYVMKLDTYITTIRKHKGSVWMGIQDFEQLSQVYGKTGAEVIMNTSGTLFSGLTNGLTAEKISKYFGKTEQESYSTNFNKGDVSVGYSAKAQELLPAAKIMNLSQGQFVGKVADTFAQPIKQKLFSGFFNVPPLENTYKELPLRYNFSKEEMDLLVNQNVNMLKDQMMSILAYIKDSYENLDRYASK